MNFYVYTHSTTDGVVFNVGKGRGSRAYDLCSRSKKHKRIAKRCGCIVEIVWRTENEQEAFAYEVWLILHYGTYTTSYNDADIFCNFSPGGNGGGGSGPKSEETKRKMSLAQKGRPGHKPSKETRRKMSASRTGKKRSKEFCEKIRLVHLGKEKSIEHRQNLSVAKTGKKLKPHSEETKRKQSVAHLGKQFSNERKESMSKARQGKPWTRAQHNARKRSTARKRQEKLDKLLGTVKES